MSTWRAIGVALVILIAAAPVASGRAVSEPGLGKALVVFANEGDIYTVHPDGTHMRRLTRTKVRGEALPSWSPDGRRIAFEVDSGFDTPSFVYTMSAAGTGSKRVVRVPDGYATPAWSPDGKTIAFGAYSDTTPAAKTGIYLVGNDGRGLRRIPNTVDGDTEPNWSPDGKSLVFNANGASVGRGGNGIVVIGVDGRGRRNLTRGNHDYDPAFSPDGRTIAFSRGDGTTSDVWLMRADGTGARRLTRLGYAGNPTWSPDGRHLVFTVGSGASDSAGSLSVMDADGRHQHSIGVDGGSPDW